MSDEICHIDAVTLTKLIRTKALSPVEVINAVLERIDRLNPLLNAFCTLLPELARDRAKELEADIMSGKTVGVLAGVPVGVKDLIFTQGMRTTFGTVAYADFIPDEDDVVVERLKAAGAIILGKTNTSELGYSAVTHNSIFGTTYNPWNPDLTSGGSSGGSGVAVATGMSPLAVGSDGGGSVRVPSSFCGIFGMKPSMGRVPAYPGCRDDRYPGISSWESLEHIGPMTRTVADSALMLSVIAGPDDRDRHSLPSANFDWMQTLEGDLKGLKVAYSPDWGYAAVAPEIREIVGRAVKVFEQLGCIVEEAHPGWDDPYDTFAALVALDSDLVGMRQMAEKWRSHLAPYILDLVQKNWTAEQFTNALTARKALCNKMWKFMRQYDLLLTPTVTIPPFPVGIPTPEIVESRSVRIADWLGFTFPLNMTGQPAATVPAGWTTTGLPVGLQIIGRHLDDPLVLKASAAFEQVAPWKAYYHTMQLDKIKFIGEEREEGTGNGKQRKKLCN